MKNFEDLGTKRSAILKKIETINFLVDAKNERDAKIKIKKMAALIAETEDKKEKPAHQVETKKQDFDIFLFTAEKIKSLIKKVLVFFGVPDFSRIAKERAEAKAQAKKEAKAEAKAEAKTALLLSSELEGDIQDFYDFAEKHKNERKDDLFIESSTKEFKKSGEFLENLGETIEKYSSAELDGGSIEDEKVVSDINKNSKDKKDLHALRLTMGIDDEL